MEEDAGKSLHDGFPDSATRTYVDLNRCGTPLIEIVSEPDMRTPDEAYEYLTRLKEIMLYTGVSDCNMEEGSLRCDANVSVRPRGQEKFGTKAEVKNVNSFRFIRAALEYEIERQIEIVSNPAAASFRKRASITPTKAAPTPCVPRSRLTTTAISPSPIFRRSSCTDAWKSEIAARMPELPEARRARMIAEYGITEQDAHTLTATRAFADQFEAAARAAKNPRRVANLVQSELTMRLKAAGLELEQSPISMKGVAQAADLAEDGKLSSKAAQAALRSQLRAQ